VRLSIRDARGEGSAELDSERKRLGLLSRGVKKGGSYDCFKDAVGRVVICLLVRSSLTSLNENAGKRRIKRPRSGVRRARDLSFFLSKTTGLVFDGPESRFLGGYFIESRSVPIRDVSGRKNKMFEVARFRGDPEGMGGGSQPRGGG